MTIIKTFLGFIFLSIFIFRDVLIIVETYIILEKNYNILEIISLIKTKLENINLNLEENDFPKIAKLNKDIEKTFNLLEFIINLITRN